MFICRKLYFYLTLGKVYFYKLLKRLHEENNDGLIARTLKSPEHGLGINMGNI